ncbi:Ankyrin repeat domain-containing protein 44 [Aspergillus hancockii]|nr:Ankyrin repeat domain-containing protein 44 [Aspergillus hancockii]
MHLLQFPNELLQLIADNLTTDADLYALIQVHSHFYRLFETQLYENNVRYHNGESSALVWAAAHGQIKIAKKSLQANANVDSVGPMHKSIFRWNLSACPSIILPSSPVYYRNPVDLRYKATPLMLAAACGHKDMTELLVNHGADVNNEIPEGYTPLLAAVAQGHTEIVEYLLANGASVTAMLDVHCYEPLELAVHENRLEVVKVLLRHGVDPNKSSPLTIAAKRGYMEVALEYAQPMMVDLLLKYGGNIEYRDPCGMTPLVWAAFWRNEQATEALLRHGANVNACRRGATALTVAIDEGEESVVKLLLENGDLNAPKGWASNKQPLLLRAITVGNSGNSAIVELLVKHGANPNEVPSNVKIDSTIWSESSVSSSVSTDGEADDEDDYDKVEVSSMRRLEENYMQHIRAKALMAFGFHEFINRGAIKSAINTLTQEQLVAIAREILGPEEFRIEQHRAIIYWMSCDHSSSARGHHNIEHLFKDLF